MTTKRLQNSTPVIVRTERGDEVGTVIGSTNPVGREQVRYTVRFADRTQSTWSEHQVRVVPPSAIGFEARCECGETFNPADADDLEHLVREDGTECGMTGTLVGSWA